MANTVGKGFREFHGNLTPTRGEAQAAKKHRASIHACLEKHFGPVRLFRTGSFGNGTSIQGHSDIDYFACISAEMLEPNSSTALQQVEKALRTHFPNAKIKGPAIVVDFRNETSRPAEIVPAKLVKQNAEGDFIYQIANGHGNGGWMRSSPDAHNKYVREIHKRLGRKVKPLVTFLKAWRYYHQVPIRSFYLEMRVAKYASQEGLNNYSRDLTNILKLLLDDQLAPLKDPKNISGSILPCSSEARKPAALLELKKVCQQAENAYKSENLGKIEDAFYWWNLVFAGNFPSYN